MKILWLVFAAVVLRGAGTRAADRLVIHEWGTLTSLEDENGQAIPGINADDEPVPDFVHRVSRGLLLPPNLVGKSVPAVHPDVTTRLETPVLYVHAPAGFARKLDVSVKFLGGWLTEFYPDADVDAPGIDLKTGRVGRIRADTAGTLDWKGLKIGGNAQGPATTDSVWLSPRNVAADNISAAAGESEKFLFYRGVGCEKPILKIVRDAETGTLKALPAEGLKSGLPFWLADIRPDGSAAFQVVAAGKSSRPFQQVEYSAASVTALRTSLEAELIREGLYKDEAEALLNTWEVSYFKSPGLRAFYMWPRDLVDRMLPLTVSPAAAITRVMVGRIELVTPEERKTVARISALQMEDSVRLFAELGRFRDALLLDADRRQPRAELEAFMQRSAVGYYRP